MRPGLHRALAVAAALAFTPALSARAQDTEPDVDLRSLDSSGRGTTLPVSPVSAPPLNAAPRSADTESPPASQDQNTQDPNAPNYGKPRPKKPKLYQLYRPVAKTSTPLSPLVPYRGAPGPQRKVLNPKPVPIDSTDVAQPAPTVAVIPSPPRPQKPVVETDPFAPLGVRVGELRLLPFVEATGGYETNPNQVVSGVKASPALRGSAGLDVVSDFPVHSFTASLRGGYFEYPANTDADRPDVSGNAVGRIDVTRNDQINVEGRFSLATQTPGSALLAVPNSVRTTNRPLVMSEGATLGGTHDFGRFSLGLRGTVDRTTYGDATQSDGTVYRYSQDDYNDYGLITRASYELTPAVIPFAEVGGDQRVRDNAVDFAGYLRDSVGFFARAGTTLEIGRLVTGSISAGYLQRHYADPRLTDLKGPTLDAALVYAATPLTTVTLKATTTAAETTLAGASGAISRQVSLEVGHTFFRNFTLTGIATYQPNEYQGVTVDESFTQFTLKGAYSLSREVQLIASATHQQLTSSLRYNNFTDTTFLAGVRLQR